MAKEIEEINTRVYRDDANGIEIKMIKHSDNAYTLDITTRRRISLNYIEYSGYRLEIEWPPEYTYPVIVKGRFGTVDIEAISDDLDEIIAMLNEIWRNSEKGFDDIDGLYVVKTDLTQVMKELREKLRNALKDLLDEII
ncbi:hypothetical protein ATG_17550 [Desulfurococcaceae archaeon AG1]|nr:hypothetical protein ATG_17550 [Desulfurococcaceae archaeon AG1]